MSLTLGAEQLVQLPSHPGVITMLMVEGGSVLRLFHRIRVIRQLLGNSRGIKYGCLFWSATDLRGPQRGSRAGVLLSPLCSAATFSRPCPCRQTLAKARRLATQAQ